MGEVKVKSPPLNSIVAFMEMPLFMDKQLGADESDFSCWTLSNTDTSIPTSSPRDFVCFYLDFKILPFKKHVKEKCINKMIEGDTNVS